MSAKKPNDWHTTALSAFQNGWITREEYKECVVGRAWVSGRSLRVYDKIYGIRMKAWFPVRGKVR